MTEAAHFVVGAAICRYVRPKPLGLALAFASHWVTDGVPHFEHPWVVGMADWMPVAVAGWVLTLSIAVGIWLCHRPARGTDGWTRLYLIAGGFAGGLPDQLKTWFGRSSLAWAANKEAHWWGPWYRSVAHEPRVALPLAITMTVVELGTIALALWLLFRAADESRPAGRSAE